MGPRKNCKVLAGFVTPMIPKGLEDLASVCSIGRVQGDVGITKTQCCKLYVEDMGAP